MALSNFSCNIFSSLLLILISQCQEVIESNQNGLFQFQFSTQYNQHQYQNFFIAQLLDGNYLPEFRFYHTINQEVVILSLEIGNDKKLFESIMSHEDYHNKTHQLTFIYNPLTLELNVEIIQVQNNLKILQLEHYENLKLNILQIGGSDYRLSKYNGIIQLNRLSFHTIQLIASINNRLIETSNEFQYIILDQYQKEYVIVNENYNVSNQIVLYGNFYEEKAELNLQFQNYQHICITDLFLMNEKTRLIIDSQSEENISFNVQNSTMSGYICIAIQNISYLEINNVNFNNITDLSFQFQEEITNLTINFINVRFYNCSFSKTQLFPPIQRGDITFINVQFIKCLFAHNSFIYQPYPGFLKISINSILIMQSHFLIENMFQDIAVVYVQSFRIQECNLIKSMIFSGNSQITFKDFEIYNTSFDQSFLFLMFISDLDLVQQAFKLDGLFINNSTIKNHQANLIAVTGYKYCQISNCIYLENKIMSNQQQYIFFIVANMVIISNFHIEKTNFQTEFNIKYSEIIIVKNIVLSGINNHHISFIEFTNSTQFSLRNISISNLEMIDAQLFMFKARTLKFFIISDVSIYNINYDFSNFSSQDQIEMFKLIDCNYIDISYLNLNNITYFIGLNELKQTYLIFHFFGSKLIVQMSNISIQNVQSYCLEQYSGMLYLYAPIIYVEGSALSILNSRFENLKSNLTTADNYIGQLILNQIEIVSSNFSNISGLQIFQIQLLQMGLSYIYNCIFHKIKLFNQDNLILFDSKISQLTCQVNEIILQSIKCQQVCKFMEFISSQINNYVVISNIELSDIQLIYFNSNNDKCLVALQNITISNKNIQLSNIIDVQCSTIIMQNLSFQGDSCGNFLNLQNFSSLKLYQIYVINAVFYESSILYITSQNKESQIIIRQLEIFNNKIISQDIFSQRILQNINNQYLFEIITQDAQMKIFIEFSKFSNNICSQCHKGLINILSNDNSESQLVIQSTLFQTNKGSMQSIVQIENFQLFQLRLVVFYSNTFEDQYLLQLINTEVRIFQCSIFNDKILQNSINRTDYFIQFCQLFGQNNEQNISKHNNNQPQINQKQGIPLHLRLFQNNAQFLLESFRNELVLQDCVKVNKYKIYGEEQFQNQLLLPSNNIYPYSQFDPHQQTNIFYDLNYTIRVIDRQGDILADQYDQQLQLQQYLYNLTSLAQIELLDEQVLYFDRQKQGFKLGNFKIKFNPYSENSLCIQLQIKYEKLENYYFLINIKTFKCQIGEYLSNNACHQCDENKYQYSLKPHQQICKQVDFKKIEEFRYNQVKLKKGFWRKDILSEEFLFCENNPQSCQGGWKAGNQQCANSYIGPLCEECDQHNIMGNGYHHKNYYNKCYQCNHYQSIIIIVSTVGWLIILTCYVLRNIQNQNRLLQQYFLQYKQFEILYKLNQNQQNTVIKQFFNISLIQMLISLINGWQTDSIDHLYYFISNPLSFNKINIQCLFEMHDPRYLLIIYALSPYFLILLILCCFYFIRQYPRNNSSINYSTIIFILSLMQPNIIKEMALFLSYRQILNNIYPKGSLQYLYNSVPHQLWIKILIAPQFLFYSLTLPFLMFYLLLRIRNDRFQKVNRFKFNILFNDYKTKFYFWEIYKILNREIVIIIIIFYDNQTRKLQGIFLLLSIYCFLINKFKPFNLVQFNKSESQNHIILQINIIILIVLNQLSNQEYIRLIMLGIYQTQALILLVLFIYQLKMNTQKLFYGIIRKMVIKSYLKYNWIQNWIQKKEEQQMKINIYWNLIKKRSRRINRYGSSSSLPILHNQVKTNKNSDLKRMNDYLHVDSSRNNQN